MATFTTTKAPKTDRLGHAYQADTSRVGSVEAPSSGWSGSADQAGDGRASVDLRTADAVADLPVRELETQLVWLARQLASGTYELLVLVGELDARCAYVLSGALSCSAWLADICDIETSTARTQVRVARALRQWTLLDAAVGDGDVSYAKARVLVPHLTDHNVGPLVDLSMVTPAGRLGAAIAAWSQRHEDSEIIDARQHDARSMSWRTEGDGMVTITARLPPAQAGAVCAVIDQQVTVTNEPAGASGPQQRADALVAVVTGNEAGHGTGSDGTAGDGTIDDRTVGPRSGSNDLVGGRVTTEVVVHVRSAGNTLTDGTPLSDHAVTRLLPNAFISLLFYDNQGYPIDASPRRRAPTRRQRRVLDERSPECELPGCHAQAFLDYDHILRYTDGGTTTLDNLRRLCGPHNRAREPQPYITGRHT